ncbi:glycoside hydrolase family 3 N-terminal domain-containing protein [Microbacterium sp. NPDC089320]|uniref:glycoside hydrolase family 3 N-terminal domain-containing protein n=1 Tax=Microbacterium sp. NPDC089320 TaxID=3155182 RepID=UPI00343AB537
MTSNDHRNAALSSRERADLLLREMTTLEKAWQLTAVQPWKLTSHDGAEPPELDRMLKRNPGHISNLASDDPATTARLATQIQRVSVERTRLGIPALIHTEALNGVMGGGHTVFPTAIGLAATWSPDLIEEMADVIRVQMHRIGLRQALSPNMDIAPDPRWGRVHETYGEDPYLSAALSVAFTRGLQGRLTDGVVATAKHFVGYGKPEAGINLGGVEIGARALRDTYAFPFEAAIQMAGLASVMNSYSDIDGIPVGASREILTDLLRDVLGFTGFVTSDYTTLDHMVDRQRNAADPAEAGRLALRAGLDTENPVAYGYGDTIAAEVERGAIEVDLLDTAAHRILVAKFDLGLFEHPYPQETIEVAGVAAEGLDLNRELAARSVVLVKNDGILPLEPGTQRVAVIGPHADAVKLQFPTYTFPAWREMMQVMSSGGFGNAVGVDKNIAEWNDAVLPPRDPAQLLAESHDATPLHASIAAHAASVVTEQGSTLTRPIEGGIERAVAAAKDSDVVVLALGGASLWFNGERTEGEGSDSADIALPAAQQELAEAVAATGKRLVVVLTQGRAYALPAVVRDAAAIVVATFGGAFGQAAVADALFGAVDPSGHLPYTVPRHVGQVPLVHHHKAGTAQRNPLPPGTDRLYLDMPSSPLYPFGHGLSYTSFALSDLAVGGEIDAFGRTEVSLTVTNTGDRAGAAVPQLYLRVNTTGVTRPAQQLGGFARVVLEAGDSRRVTFTIDATQLGYTNVARDFAVEPARVDVFVGLDSDDRALEGSFDVVGAPRVLGSAERTFLTDVAVSEA